ncbi:MAG: hypothetical protein H6706_09680 [Myxococcales bacterium]|nr:hypothetical protein [Myxococcales bacterium]
MIDRPRAPRVVVGLLFLLSWTVVLVVGDRPRALGPGAGPKAGRAAVAWRDHEIPFFQWGTQLYTLPLLRGVYAEVAYVTERTPADRDRLVRATEDLLRRYEAVDVFLAVHGGRTLPHVFRQIDPSLRRHLRLVYSTGCADAVFGERWLELGAQAFVGHRGRLSISPIFFVYFLRRWSEGRTLAEAVVAANAQAANRLGPIAGFLPDGLDPVAETRAELLGDAALSLR